MRRDGNGYRFSAPLWLWDGDAGWHFVTLPKDVSDEIEIRTLDDRRGFGSVKVRVTVADVTWDTSVFPDKTREAYVLPVKKQVRKTVGLEIGDSVDVGIELI